MKNRISKIIKNFSKNDAQIDDFSNEERNLFQPITQIPSDLEDGSQVKIKSKEDHINYGDFSQANNVWGDFSDDYLDMASLNAFIVDSSLLSSESSAENNTINYCITIFVISTIIFVVLLLEMRCFGFLFGFILGTLLISGCLVIYGIIIKEHRMEQVLFAENLQRYIRSEIKRRQDKINFLQCIPVNINHQIYIDGWMYVNQNINDPKLPKNKILHMPVFAKITKSELQLFVCNVNLENYAAEALKGNYKFHTVYALRYHKMKIEIVPNTITYKRVWSRKHPVKISYFIGGISSSDLTNEDQSLQPIIKQREINHPQGLLPKPNPRHNLQINLNKRGGHFYVYFLNGKDKERWYNSLCYVIKENYNKLNLNSQNVPDVPYIEVNQRIDFLRKMQKMLLVNQEITTDKNLFRNSTYSYVKLPDNQHNEVTKPPRPSRINIPVAKSELKIVPSSKQGLNTQNLLSINPSIGFNPMDVNVPTNLDELPKRFSNIVVQEKSKKNTTKGSDLSHFGLIYSSNSARKEDILTSKATLALNVLANRFFWDFWREHKWKNIVKLKIQNKLDQIKLPGYIKNLVLMELDMGESLPTFCTVTDPYLDEEGGLWFKFPIVYDGRIYFTFNAQFNMKFYENLLDEVSGKLDNQAGVGEPEYMEKQFIDEARNLLEIDSLGGSDNQNYDNSSVTLERCNSVGVILNDDKNSVDTVRTSSHHKKGKNHLKFKSSIWEKSLNELDQDEADIKFFLESTAGKKVYNVLEKLGSSKVFNKMAKTSLMQKLYKKAKDKVENSCIILSVEVTSVRGTINLYIRPPPTDRIWISFIEPPAMNIKVKPKVNSKLVKLPALTSWIMTKIQQEIRDSLVLPNMEDLVIPLMSANLDFTAWGFEPRRN